MNSSIESGDARFALTDQRDETARLRLILHALLRRIASHAARKATFHPLQAIDAMAAEASSATGRT